MADQEDQHVAADAGAPASYETYSQGGIDRGFSMLVAMIVLLVGVLARMYTTQVRSRMYCYILRTCVLTPHAHAYTAQA